MVKPGLAEMDDYVRGFINKSLRVIPFVLRAALGCVLLIRHIDFMDSSDVFCKLVMNRARPFGI